KVAASAKARRQNVGKSLVFGFRATTCVAPLRGKNPPEDGPRPFGFLVPVSAFGAYGSSGCSVPLCSLAGTGPGEFFFRPSSPRAHAEWGSLHRLDSPHLCNHTTVCPDDRGVESSSEL